jgi:release factor glutamine methyltransferase
MSTTASGLLAEASDLAEHEARRLLLVATGRSVLYLVGDPALSPEECRRFRALIERRRAGEPLQHIEGTVQFGPIELRTTSAALIPRPETERLWEICTERLAEFAAPTIIDLCTGSGNLALALRHALPESVVYATDLSGDALDLARRNATDLGLDVTLLQGDLFAPLPGALRGSVDLIVANPPYISEGEFLALPTEVASHEPEMALVAGADGLDVLRRIAQEAVDWLRPGGLVACEIGETQGEDCRDLFAAYDPQILRDLADRDRFVLGSAPMARDVH